MPLEWNLLACSSCPVSVCVCLFVEKKFNFCHNLGTLKSRDFTFGMHTVVTQLMKQIHWNEKSMTLWPWPLYKCTKIAIWNFVAAGAFVFHLGFFRYLTLGPGPSTDHFPLHYGIEYMSIWHSILQCLIDQRGRWIYTDAYKSVKWLVDKSQYYWSYDVLIVWWTVEEMNKNQQCLYGTVDIH